jgi:hypothetical protein
LVRVDPELGKDLAKVVLDGVRADEQPRPDFRVREAVAGETGDLRLLGGKVAPCLDGAFAGMLAGRSNSTRARSANASIPKSEKR